MSQYPRVSRFGVAFGKYRLVQRLHDIEVGDAHLAKLIGMEGFEKRVVIWRVGGTPLHDTTLVDAVMCEAKRGASLSHANIAQVLDLGVVDGLCFVVTEHVSGHTLEAVLHGTLELPWPIAAHIASEVARALSYAQSRRSPDGKLLGLVHRRLSPIQIAISAAGDVKVTGFGTSWAWPALDEYRSAEEARGEPVDGRADVFALGAILRRCVPRMGVPESLQRLIDHATQPYPEQRPAAAELQQELTHLLHAAERPVTPREIAALYSDSGSGVSVASAGSSSSTAASASAATS